MCRHVARMGERWETLRKLCGNPWREKTTW